MGLAVPFVLILSGAAEARQLALVVGNGAYPNLAVLKHPASDATAVADALKRLDYDVTLLTDATGAEFDAALAAFAADAAGGDVENTLFYYAGHAFQFGDANYLVPIEASLSDRGNLGPDSRSLDALIDQIAVPGGQSFIFLDTGLANPLPPDVAGNDSGKGLAEIAKRPGTMIAYAAQPDTFAVEGAGAMSPFTTGLLAHIEEPGISISDMMVLVRTEVELSTEGKQKPWDRSALRAQYYFQPVYETSAALTAADYEMLAELDPEVKEKLLALLNDTGVSLEIEVLEEAELQLASIAQTVIIEAVADEEPAPVEASAPSDLKTTAIAPSMSIIALPEEGDAPEAAPTASISIGAPEAPSIAVGTINAPTAEAPVAAIAAPGTVLGATTEAAPNLPTLSSAPAPELPAPTVAIVATPDIVTAPGTPDTAPAPLALAAVDPGQSAAPGLGVPVAPGGDVLPGGTTNLAMAPVAAPAPDTAPEAAVEIPEDLPRAVQTELARLGCYRSAIDGAWGKGSALSLVRYYSAKNAAPETLQPTAELYVALTKEENVLCKLTTTTAKIPTTIKPTAAAVNTGKKRIVTTSTSTDGTKKTITRINTGVFR